MFLFIPFGYDCLRFKADGTAFLVGPGLSPKRASHILKFEVVEVNGELVSGSVEGQSQKLELTVPAPSYRSMVLDPDEPQSFEVWKVPFHCKGVQHWWCAGDIVYAMGLGFDDGGQLASVARYILDSWNRWIGFLSPFASPFVCLRKGIDRRGRDTHWSRMFPETALFFHRPLGNFGWSDQQLFSPRPFWPLRLSLTVSFLTA